MMLKLSWSLVCLYNWFKTTSSSSPFFQVDNQTASLPVAFITNVGNALDRLFPHQFREPFEYVIPIKLVGYLGYHDAFLPGFCCFHVRPRTDGNRSAPRSVTFLDSSSSAN